jgi:beta-galactosidase/arabinogalactan endo-1,4-beta-galactosidase
MHAVVAAAAVPALVLTLAIAAIGATEAREQPFILGADISWLPQREAEGRGYYDQGAKRDALLILKDHKFNYIRLRIFHNPRATGGYSPQGYCDLEQTKAMARRVKAAGMRFLLDFHYSDTWADPGAQKKPAAWASLGFADLARAVHDYTLETLEALRAQGTLPDMVQIGNEINPGFLLPDGSSQDFGRLAALLGAGIAAVREADPGILAMIHLAAGGDNALCRWFMDGLLEEGLVFDVLGLSCYTEWQGPPSGWESNFQDLATRYPEHRFVAAEYSHEKRAVNDILFGLPGGRGLGTFIWEPLEWQESVFTWRSASRWDANALLDLYPVMSREYGNDAVSVWPGGVAPLRADRNGSRLRILGPQGPLFRSPAGGRLPAPRNALGRLPN